MDIQVPLIYAFRNVLGFYAVHPKKKIAVLMEEGAIPPKRLNFDYYSEKDNDWDLFLEDAIFEPKSNRFTLSR